MCHVSTRQRVSHYHYRYSVQSGPVLPGRFHVPPDLRRRILLSKRNGSDRVPGRQFLPCRLVGPCHVYRLFCRKVPERGLYLDVRHRVPVVRRWIDLFDYNQRSVLHRMQSLHGPVRLERVHSQLGCCLLRLSGWQFLS